MKRFLLLCAAAFVATGIFLSWFVPRAWFWVGSEQTASVTVVIGDNWHASRTGKELQKHGIIDSAFGYRLYSTFNSIADRPIAGEYHLVPHSSFQTVSRQLAFGPPRNEVKITVVEGWTIDSINKALAPYSASIPSTIPEELRRDYPFLASLPAGTSFEGYLFPDTYRVYADQLPQALIKKQLDEFAERAPGLEAEAKKQGRTLRDVVILASIIEKEVSKPEDRKIVASIFLNRLKDGMALQSDATVNYITHAGRARPTLKDLEADSLYNTYRHKGLPPGPVSNPGDTALEAAIHPAETNYRYFLTDDSGKTYFGRTFEDHQRNRQAAYGE